MEILDVQSKYGPFRATQIDIFKTSPLWSQGQKSTAWVKKLQEEYQPVPQSKLLALQKRHQADCD